MLDEETVGRIEKGLSKMISDTDMRNRIRWVLKEISVHSEEDFAFGYLIGALAFYAYDEARTMKLHKMIDKSLEETLGKEQLMEMKMKREREEESEGHKPVHLTKKEDTQVRNMLIRILVQTRRKVHGDFHR